VVCTFISHEFDKFGCELDSESGEKHGEDVPCTFAKRDVPVIRAKIIRMHPSDIIPSGTFLDTMIV